MRNLLRVCRAPVGRRRSKGRHRVRLKDGPAVELQRLGTAEEDGSEQQQYWRRLVHAANPWLYRKTVRGVEKEVCQSAIDHVFGEGPVFVWGDSSDEIRPCYVYVCHLCSLLRGVSLWGNLVLNVRLDAYFCHLCSLFWHFSWELPQGDDLSLICHTPALCPHTSLTVIVVDVAIVADFCVSLLLMLFMLLLQTPL